MALRLGLPKHRASLIETSAVRKSVGCKFCHDSIQQQIANCLSANPTLFIIFCVSLLVKFVKSVVL